MPEPLRAYPRFGQGPELIQARLGGTASVERGCGDVRIFSAD